MTVRRNSSIPSTARQARRRNTVVSGRIAQRQPKRARRSISGRPKISVPFAPPEDWHEPTDRTGYRVIQQTPGPGYHHIVTPAQVRQRLAAVPQSFLSELEVVQLSRMTRKKQCFPCYGMQWGNALYLYPLEETLIEHFFAPPLPNLINEAQMYGGRWDHSQPGVWTLTWSEQAAQDFYLNNILIHELGHLVDDRNSNYMDRERFAEWFAIEYGYRRTKSQRANRPVRRRHHAC